jgi:transcriptional regulator with XRE-family HTH domain
MNEAANNAQGRSEPSKSIGERLRAARHARGISLQALSDLTGGSLSKSRISNYEQGIRRLSVEGAKALAEALGNTTAAHLLCVDDGETKSPEEMQLLNRYRSADTEGKAAIMALAEQQGGG